MMTEKLNVLLLVAARGGASGIPAKNLAQVGGIPLIGRAARVACGAARRFAPQSRVICSTDDEKIAQVARVHGAEVPFLRPAHLDADSAGIVDVALHALSQLAAEFDAIVVVQALSPLLEAEDIVGAVALFAEASDPVIAVVADDRPRSGSYLLDDQERLIPLIADDVSRRQGPAPSASYYPSGAVHVTTPSLLAEQRRFWVEGRTRGFVMPARRGVCIEDEVDLQLAEALLAARPVAPLEIGGRAVGPGHPCFVIAEAGVNHNGEIDLARQMVDVAAAAGADAVKFQVFRAEEVISAAAQQAAYQRTNTGVEQSQLEMVRRLEIDAAGHRQLFEYCASKNILYLASPFDEGSVDLLCEMGVDAIKVGSGELTNHDLLRYIAGKGLPVLLSTGMAEMVEVDDAVDVVRREHPAEIGIFHCVSNYPASPTDCNLKALDTLAREYSVPVGWSDHTLGTHVALAAVGRGASLLEKHFTLDCNLPGPDHRASIEPDELSLMVAAVRDVEQALGDGIKRPAASETDTARAARRSLHAARDLVAGTTVHNADLVALRPGTGIAANQKHRLLGRRLARDVGQGQLLGEDDLDE